MEVPAASVFMVKEYAKCEKSGTHIQAGTGARGMSEPQSLRSESQI
jgi:hypothetical protein